MLAGVNLVVTFAANDDEIPFYVRSSIFMMLEVVQFEDSRVAGGPALMLPSANPACVAVPFVYCPLNGLRDLTVVRLGNAFSGLQDVLPSLKVGAACQTSGDGVAVLGSELPDPAGVLLGFFCDISQYFRSQNLSYVFHEVLKKSFLASYVASSSSIGYVPPTRGIQIGLRVN